MMSTNRDDYFTVTDAGTVVLRWNPSSRRWTGRPDLVQHAEESVLADPDPMLLSAIARTMLTVAADVGGTASPAAWRGAGSRTIP